MDYIRRALEHPLRHALQRGKSVLLLGARQTGKTTLIAQFTADKTVSLVRADDRIRYEKNPALLAGEIEALKQSAGDKRPLVVIDEVQRVPTLLDEVQDLIDRGIAQFILTGSSARKLRRHAPANLLPGRVTVFHLDPFSLMELPEANLEQRLLDGSLPGIVRVTNPDDRERDLADYVLTYLEEEIRAEAAVRNLGAFARFLELAASESGRIINFRKLSEDIGVAHTTIAAYYQILEDCLIGERIQPLCESGTRRKLTKSDRFLFFDLGVRRIAAREGRQPPLSHLAALFEQFVGLELVRHVRSRNQPAKVRFWRDPDGPEVDWLVEYNGAYLPIEVKWTDAPSAADSRHIRRFLSEYPSFGKGFVVCRSPHPVKLDEKTTALPWQEFIQAVDRALSAVTRDHHSAGSTTRKPSQLPESVGSTRWR